MPYDGFKTQTEIDNERKAAEEKEETVVKPCGERLKDIFKNTKHSKDVDKREDALFSTKEGVEEMERFKQEVLEVGNNTGERHKIVFRHEQRWRDKFANGGLTPLKK